MPTPYKMIDLFSGAGGMTHGFVEAGFAPILAVEKERDFAATYELNFGGHVISNDITQIVDKQLIRCEADIVIGGPPCQGFSNLTGNRVNDPRRAMWQYFMQVVMQTKAKVFVIENVQNLLKSEEGQSIIRKGEELGYHVASGVLLASEFGVPQNRRRAIIIGSRLAPLELPAPNGNKTTVREAFRGIPLKPTHTDLHQQPATGPDLHIARNPTAMSLQRYKLIPPGGNRFDLQRAAPNLTPDCWIKKTQGGTDLFGRLDWDSPARCTIRTEFYKPEKGRYLHPSEHRPITHWEAARLQTFPDTFRWCGTKIRIAIQIGNAVPPTFAQAIASHVMRHMESHKAKCCRKPSPNLLPQPGQLLLF